MTDLVARLRFNANRKSNLDADKASLLEAADEIERLRQDNAEMQKLVDTLTEGRALEPKP